MVYYRFDEKLAVAVCTVEEVKKSYSGSKLKPSGVALEKLVDYLDKLGRGA